MRVLLVHKRSNLDAYTRQRLGRQSATQRAAVERVSGMEHGLAVPLRVLLEPERAAIAAGPSQPPPREAPG